MEAVTVGLDIGTTSIKAVAVDSSGQVLRRARIRHQVIVPEPHLMEHDAERAWRRGPKRALAALGDIRPASIAVTAMVPSLTAVDRRGRPLTPGLLYGDGRALTAAADPGGAEPAGTGAEPTGGGKEPTGSDIPTSGGEVEGFIRWTAGAAPDAHGYWPAQAVANTALGARPAVDFAVAFIASPVYGDSGWDADICASCGISPDQLPEVELPGAPIGRLNGRADGPAITAGTVDVWCEQMVAGAAEVGDVHVICGTTLIVWAVDRADRGPVHPAIWTVPHALPGHRMVGGASNAGGLFLDWVNRTVGRATGADLDPSNVPVWVPYPRGERTPYHDPGRRAALHDLDLTHGPDAIRRAAWEASAFVVRHHLDLGRVPARRIIATGGGTKVDGWMQAMADATGLPVHVAAEPEGAARGAAFLARLAAGLDTDVNEAARWASTRSVVEPRRPWADAAAERYQRFLDLSGPPDRPQEAE
ncbi:MAG TPA: FGGY-family carbohydrate kinase [Acidimicrobiales bacterium]|jgi:xylulokinase|nr:FGGY-family carbohydrate kinase [Acidimicrobiales bacterium]